MMTPEQRVMDVLNERSCFYPKQHLAIEDYRQTAREIVEALTPQEGECPECGEKLVCGSLDCPQWHTEPEDEWFNVKDRLPEEYERVYTWNGKSVSENEYYDGERWCGEGTYTETIYDVIAWMPKPSLPEPPTKDS